MPYIVTNTGKPHHLNEPFQVDIKSAAMALCYINRYTGHVGQYSVAQHSVFVASQLPKSLQLSGLLHDIPEAYLGDVSAPLKSLLPDYWALEDFYHKTVDEQFGVDTRHSAVVEADMRMLVTEANFFALDIDSRPDLEPFPIQMERWTAEESYRRFMDLFYKLVQEGGASEFK